MSLPIVTLLLEVQHERFIAAIACDKTKPISETVDVNSMGVESSYEGQGDEGACGGM